MALVSCSIFCPPTWTDQFLRSATTIKMEILLWCEPRTTDKGCKPKCVENVCPPTWTRTKDHRGISSALYQLSYWRNTLFKRVVKLYRDFAVNSIFNCVAILCILVLNIISFNGKGGDHIYRSTLLGFVSDSDS